MVDASTGLIMQRVEDDEWGLTVSDSNPGFQPFRFVGGLWDGDTGFIRFGARDYQSEVGRWTTKDPLRFSGGDTNLYGYVIADPINVTDVRGQDIWICSRPAFGAGGWLGNHAFFWDDSSDTTCGRAANGYNASDRPRGPGVQCRRVPGSGGYEDRIMQGCRGGGDGSGRGRSWVPGTHDCHTTIQNCLTEGGFYSPGVPGGRLGTWW